MSVVISTHALPAVLRWAVRLLWCEAVLAGLLAAVVGYRGVTAGSTGLTEALASAGFVALIAAILAGLAAALARRKPRARAPAIVLQLLTVMVGYVLLTGDVWPVGLVLGGLGVGVATLLLAPATSGALDPGGRQVGAPGGE